MKKLVTCLLVMLTACSLCLVGCNSEAPQTAVETKTLNMEFVQTDGSPIHQGALKFAELVNEYTEGRYEIAVFTNCVLGNGDLATSTEMTQKGTLDMVITSFNLFLSAEPSFAVLVLPWLQNGNDFIDKNMVFGTPLYDKIDELLQNCKVKMLSIDESGWCALTNNVRPVSTPEDMKGLKIRAINSITIDVMSALGANPTNINFGELYAAMQLGACDGQENPLAGVIVPNRFYEVQKYITVWDSVYTGLPLCMNLDLWNSLSDADRSAFQKAATEAVEFQKQVNRLAYDEAVKTCEDNGVEITVLSSEQIAVFRAAVEHLFDKTYAGADPEFMDIFNAAISN